jgi:hypothetical protein
MGDGSIEQKFFVSSFQERAFGLTSAYSLAAPPRQ